MTTKTPAPAKNFSPGGLVNFGRAVFFPGTPSHRTAIITRSALKTGLLLFIITLAVAGYAVVSGSADIAISDALSVLVGGGSEKAQHIVGDWRLPRIAACLFLGAALGVSGGIFQTLTDNALGSPDIIGFQTGAYTGAIIAIICFNPGTWFIIAGALLGGLTTAVTVFLLSLKRGRIKGTRLIIVGIGVSAMMASINMWLLLNIDEKLAIMATAWGAGTLDGANWVTTIPSIIAALIFFAATTLVAKPLQLVQMGFDQATALGVNVLFVQIAAVITGIGLVALATATAGPISFVALAAPQIARRLMRSATISYTASAITGSLLLLTADLLAQRLVPDTPIPVGVVTVSIGGCYFFWLLLKETRR